MEDDSNSESPALRIAYARSAMSNPTDHFLEDQPIDHPEVLTEWIEDTITQPYLEENDLDGNRLFYGAISGRRRWLKVVVVNDQIHTAYFDRRLTQRFGEPT